MTRVLVPLAQGCEEIEAVTVIDLLRRAGIDVVTAGLDDEVVTASAEQTASASGQVSASSQSRTRHASSLRSSPASI